MRLPAGAAELPKELTDALPSQAERLLEGETGDLLGGMSALWGNLRQEAGRILRSRLKTAAGVLFTVLLCGMLGGLREGNGAVPDFVPMGGALVIAALTAASLKNLVGLGWEAMEATSVFGKALLGALAVSRGRRGRGADGFPPTGGDGDLRHLPPGAHPKAPAAPGLSLRRYRHRRGHRPGDAAPEPGGGHPEGGELGPGREPCGLHPLPHPDGSCLRCGGSGRRPGGQGGALRHGAGGGRHPLGRGGDPAGRGRGAAGRHRDLRDLGGAGHPVPIPFCTWGSSTSSTGGQASWRRPRAAARCRNLSAALAAPLPWCWG